MRHAFQAGFWALSEHCKRKDCNEERLKAVRMSSFMLI